MLGWSLRDLVPEWASDRERATSALGQGLGEFVSIVSGQGGDSLVLTFFSAWLQQASVTKVAGILPRGHSQRCRGN